MRLATRLGITHGALVALTIVLLIVTFQGLLRMLGVMTTISDQKLSSLDAEEELHRAAWGIEVALRHGYAECAVGEDEHLVQSRIQSAKNAFLDVVYRRENVASARLRNAALQYGGLAADALSTGTCFFLAQRTTELRREKLDEEMTNAWIDRLQELHADIETKEEIARAIGRRTATSGLIVAAFGALAAIVIARWTARSIAGPVARLASDATRLGEGDFTPIPPVDGPVEIEELRSQLERSREKLLGVDRLKQAFLASVSHELRSPLGRLREAIALLEDGTVGELSARQKRVVKIAGRACEQEVRIVEALLDMSRVSSGLPVQREAGCNIEKVIRAAVSGEQDAAIERKVAIHVVWNAEPPSLTVDSALIERAVANLLRNAISVSSKGGEVRVTVDLDEANEERSVRIDVTDDGPGLSPEVEDRVFEPFAAASIASVGRPAGIGIGLSLSRLVARAHGGDIRTLREHGSTTFRMEIPLDGDFAKKG